MNGEHQTITEEQMNAYKKYTMYLSHKKEESLRGACYINYLLNYKLPVDFNDYGQFFFN